MTNPHGSSAMLSILTRKNYWLFGNALYLNPEKLAITIVLDGGVRHPVGEGRGRGRGRALEAVVTVDPTQPNPKPLSAA